MNETKNEEPKRNKLTFYMKTFYIIGLFLVVVAVGSYLFGNYMINKQIHQNIVLANNSKAYGYWANPPAKVIRKYYLFNVTNPIEVEQGTAKPRLTEMGPYCFDELLEKRNVRFLDNNRMRFDPLDTIHFEQNCSKGFLNDSITFLNIPVIGMIESLTHGNTKGWTYMGMNAMLGLLGTKLFVTKTVGELISGYEDPLLEIAKIFVPKVVTDTKFSLLHGKNGTLWQNFTMYTGDEDASQVGQIILWDDQPKLDLYEDKYANLINGTDGTIFSPFRKRDEIVYAYSADMCRSYPLTYLKDDSLEGVSTYNFHMPENVFYNSTMNPSAPTFCGISDKCLGNGVHNISKCYGGVSGFISQPHFLNAEEKFLNEVAGMKPDPNKHDFILKFEPITGVAIQGNVRLQISFYLLRNENMNIVKNVNPVLLPMVWFDEDIQLNSDIISQFTTVALITNLCFVIPLTLFCFGTFWAMIATGILVYKKRVEYKKNTNLIINETSDVIKIDDNNNEQTSDERTPLLKKPEEILI